MLNHTSSFWGLMSVVSLKRQMSFRSSSRSKSAAALASRRDLIFYLKDNIKHCSY